MQLTILDAADPEQPFPPLSDALQEPNGLLAVGGCLSTKRLLNAYRHGIFPWYNPGEPVLWWSPDPRLVLFPDKLSVSRSLKKTLNKKTFTVSFDKAFDAVVDNCAGFRKEGYGTWITADIKRAFKQLHRLGYAHSIETWFEGELVGGLYGVALGRVFFGESMFHRRTDASKVAFVSLVERLSRWHYCLIDCQVQTAHLESLGAQLIGRHEFELLLDRYSEVPPLPSAWQ
ncbi:MAG: leucyl/phenylalanyl-tRNA--protein transferase [Gammaproteobacteria bacterium]